VNNMKKTSDLNYIKELADKMPEYKLVSYDDLPKYDLFLGQVVEYLNNELGDKTFTNNIVQNYIKSEVITKPEDGKKRGYTKNHLIQLILLSYMRPILSTEEIKKVFKLAFNEINDNDDDILSWEDTYNTFILMNKESLYDNLGSHLTHVDKLDEIVKKFNLKDKDEERIKTFLLVLSLISKASAIKRLAQKIVKEYNHN